MGGFDGRGSISAEVKDALFRTLFFFFSKQLSCPHTCKIAFEWTLPKLKSNYKNKMVFTVHYCHSHTVHLSHIKNTSHDATELQ